MEMKYGFGAGRWREQEQWLQDGRVYYVSLEYFAIKFLYERRGFKKGRRFGPKEGKSVYFSIEVLL